MFEDERDDAAQDDEATQPAAAEPQDEAPEAAGAEAPEAEAETPDAAADTPDVAADTPDAAADTPDDEVDTPDPAVDAPEAAAPEVPAAAPEVPAAEESAPEAPRERPRRDRKKKDDASEPELIPGAHLEPDLVLDDAAPDSVAVGEQTAAEIQAAEAAHAEEDGPADAEAGADGDTEAAPPEAVPRATTILELAADARYRATGKRKSAVARVILKPGTGVYIVNGRELDRFFPRPTLQKTARGPLETVGQEERMDVVAQIHGGGVSAQAGALRHGVAKALVEADPNLRSELKRRGFLTRDPRVKERKKAGLKKARKRPQFSKR